MNRNAVADRLERFEGSFEFMYRATSGEVTIGIGHLIPNVAMALAVPWYGSPSNDSIMSDWRRVAEAPKGLAPGSYAGLSRLRLDSEAILDLLDEDIGQNLATLARTIPEFLSYPDPVQEALFDMLFDLGAAGLRNFEELLAACRLGDWRTAAIESRREGIAEARNAEVAALFAGVDRR